MRALNSYDYATIRLVPRVERGEFINVGVILFCRVRRYLGSRIHLDEARLQALWPECDPEPVRCYLGTIERVCDPKDDIAPLGEMSLSERFGWLVSPRSTIVQTSPVHSGLTADPEASLAELFRMMVAASVEPPRPSSTVGEE